MHHKMNNDKWRFCLVYRSMAVHNYVAMAPQIYYHFQQAHLEPAASQSYSTQNDTKLLQKLQLCERH